MALHEASRQKLHRAQVVRFIICLAKAVGYCTWYYLSCHSVQSSTKVEGWAPRLGPLAPIQK